MANTPAQFPHQHIAPDERLFRRVHRVHISSTGSISPLAFGLLDMSVEREACGSSPDSLLRGFEKTRVDWGVAEFAVRDIPNRIHVTHLGVQVYLFIARHIPLRGNWAHAEVRVFREESGVRLLITHRPSGTFGDDDPNRPDDYHRPEDPDHDAPRSTAVDHDTGELLLLDPDFHLRWRARIAFASQLALRPVMT